MKILAVDCTAKPASVAVLEDGKVLSSAYTNTGLTHSQTLVPMMDSALKNAQLSLDGIDYYAINAGPGSFTGVRIGVAATRCTPRHSAGKGKRCIASWRTRPFPSRNCWRP